MTRALLVDDDRQLLRALQITLTARGYRVIPATSGAGALAAASAQPPDVVILDLGLPRLDGVAVVEGLRGWSAAPIIVLSARHEEQAKVRALDAGADDYVTKPFGMDELLARVRAATRRRSPPTTAAVVTTAAFTIDLSARRVTSPSGDIRLTPTEWHLLEILVRDADRVDNPTTAPPAGVGAGLPNRNELSAGAPGQSAPETGAGSGSPPLPDHRTWHRIPVSTGHKQLNR